LPPPHEFLKSIYKIQSDSDHVAKFQGDRSRELGEPVAKQEKHLKQNMSPSPSGTTVPGGLNNTDFARYYVFIFMPFVYFAGRYCDPSCLLVRWLVCCLVRLFVNIRPTAALTAWPAAGVRADQHHSGMVGTLRRFATSECFS